MSTNAPRYTDKTGKFFENYCQHVLESANYNVDEQVYIGLRPTGGGHSTDLIIDNKFIISLKYQKVAGSAEEKIPYEQICLQHAIEEYGYAKAYIVLAGFGWKHDDSYIQGKLNKWLTTPNVEVISFEQFLNIFNLNDVV